MTTSDKIALAGLFFSALTSLCAIYLAYAALRHTVRPNIEIRMKSPSRLRCSDVCKMVFEVVNIGHWYGSPMAVDVTVYCDFPLSFELLEMRYGSVQEHRNNEVKPGKGGMRYLKAKGLKLSRQDYGEEVHVFAKVPEAAGTYEIRVSAYSMNGASAATDLTLDIVTELDRVILI